MKKNYNVPTLEIIQFADVLTISTFPAPPGVGNTDTGGNGNGGTLTG